RVLPHSDRNLRRRLGGHDPGGVQCGRADHHPASVGHPARPFGAAVDERRIGPCCGAGICLRRPAASGKAAPRPAERPAVHPGGGIRLLPTSTSRTPPLPASLSIFSPPGPPFGAASPAVQIFDGPATTMLDSPLKLYVGWTDPDNAQEESGAESFQE